MKKIVIAHGHTSIEIFHSLSPLVLAAEKTNGSWDWKFLDYMIFDIFKAQGDLLILVRKYHDGKKSNDEMEAELIQLRKNFKKIVYFDDSAAASVVLFSIFEFVDEYWKRSIFKDFNLYSKKFYGGHLFSDYYHEKYNINDGDKLFFNQTHQNVDLSKLKIAWNIGIGLYPTSDNIILNRHYMKVRRLFTGLSALPFIKPIREVVKLYTNSMKKELEREVSFKEKKRIISGRFESEIYRNSIGFQRVMMQKKIEGRGIYLRGKVDRWSFTKEASIVRGMLSPFGWGEVCYRDFEAALGGAVLIKPSMDHIETWPNIYTNKSYVPLSWDLKELDGLDIDNLDTDIINSARKTYLDTLNSMADRAITMINK